MEQDYVNERLDHLGIVAGVCQELGLVAWLDAQEPTNRQPRERGHRHSGHDSQWLGVQQSAVVFSPPVLCEQTCRTLGFEQE